MIPSAPSRIAEEDALATPRPVRAGPMLLALGVLLVGAADAVVLALTTGYFGGGYNSPILRDVPGLAGFVVAGAVLDAALLTAAFALAWLLTRVLAARAGALPRLALAAGLALVPPLVVDVVSHQLHRVFGHVIGFDVLIQLAGGGLGTAALEAATEAPVALLVLGAALAALLVGARLLRRVEPALASRVALVPPASRRVVALAAATAALGALLLGWSLERAPTLAYGLTHKPSGRALLLLVRSATDVDRDGFGLLSRPPDPAAFDASRHPFALEIAGNGIDENGIGGDLPRDFVPQGPISAPARVGSRRPPLLIVFLESFRGDLIGMRLAGREVTPTLNRLAHEGASSQQTYAHNPLTWPSRAQLFQGRLRPEPGGRTLIDDFRDLGYRVAYFSGQDDSHGGSEPLVGFDRADVFYDARADREQRSSRTALPASLQVAWPVVLARVEEYLDETSGDPRPLLLYVNLVDNHYPYHHEGLERLLGVEPVSRAEIRPHNAKRVFETYLQAAANVDRGVDALVRLWRERMGQAPLIVTADHGQSFYENGMLGHGQSVDDAQSRVPLILLGIGGAWPEPLGLADVRGLLLRNLFEGPGRARFGVVPERRVFQYIGALERPRLIALRGPRETSGYELPSGRATTWSNEDFTAPLDAQPEEQARLVWSWERLLLSRASGAD